MQTLSVTEHDLDWTIAAGLPSVVQRVEQKLRFFRGDWYQDVGAGTPLVPGVLGRQADTALAARILADSARAVTGVTAVTSASFRIESDPPIAAPRLERGGHARLAIDTLDGSATVEIEF